MNDTRKVAAQPAEPVALGDALRWSKAAESQGAYVFTPAQLRVFYEYATRAAPPAPALTYEQIRDLAKESGLDWHRGYMPLFDDDPTNRYEVFARAVLAAGVLPAPAAVPLTDEQIDAIIKQHTGGFIGGMHFVHLARAIEKAHGITA